MVESSTYRCTLPLVAFRTDISVPDNENTLTTLFLNTHHSNRAQYAHRMPNSTISHKRVLSQTLSHNQADMSGCAADFQTGKLRISCKSVCIDTHFHAGSLRFPSHLLCPCPCLPHPRLKTHPTQMLLQQGKVLSVLKYYRPRRIPPPLSRSRLPANSTRI